MKKITSLLMMFMLFVGMGWAQSHVTDMNTISNDKAYVINSERGPILYDASHADKVWAAIIGKSVAEGFASLNVNDTKQQFGLLRGDRTPEGQFYLYCVENNKFVKRSGDNLLYTDQPESTFALSGSGEATYPWFVCVENMSNPKRLNVNSNTVCFRTNGEASPDGGNRFQIIETVAKDFKAALDKIVAAETLPVKLSSETVEYRYAIQNTRDNGYAVTVQGTDKKQGLSTANSFTGNKTFAYFIFKQSDIKESVNMYVNIAGKYYMVGADGNGGGTVVRAYDLATEAAPAYQYFTLKKRTNGNHVGYALEFKKTGDVNTTEMSWNMHGGAGKDIKLFGSDDEGSVWNLIEVTPEDGIYEIKNQDANGTRGYMVYTPQYNAEHANYLQCAGSKLEGYTGTDDTFTRNEADGKYEDNVFGYWYVYTSAKGNRYIVNLNHTDNKLRFLNIIYSGENKYAVVSEKPMAVDVEISVKGFTKRQIKMHGKNLYLNNWVGQHKTGYTMRWANNMSDEAIPHTFEKPQIVQTVPAGFLEAIKIAVEANEGKVLSLEEISSAKAYNIISPRGWMIHRTNVDVVASTARNNGSFQPTSDNKDCQWSIVKSNRGNYYLYNLGNQKFVGFTSTNNGAIPFSAMPQTTKLRMRMTTGDQFSEYPMMFYFDGVASLNHTTDFQQGLVAWTGGTTNTTDAGNISKIVEVGDLAVDLVASIADKVNAYETILSYNNCIGMVDGFSASDMETLRAMTSMEEINKFWNTNGIKFETTQLYRIKNVKRNLSLHTGSNVTGNEETAYMSTTKYYESSAVSCHTTSLADAGCVWSFEVVPNSNPVKYQLKNLNSSSYIAKTASAGSQSLEMTITDAGEYTLVHHGNGQYSFVCSNGLGSHKELHVSGSGVMNYNGGANSPSAWHLIPATELEVAMKVSDNRSYSTLHVPFSVGLPEGVKAYTGTVGIKDGLNVLTMHEQGQELPANTGVVLKDMNKQTKVSLNIMNTAAAIQGNNDITGTNVATEINAGAPNIWIFSKKNEVLGFYHYGTAGNDEQGNALKKVLAANKAYVDYTAPTGVKGFRLDFGDDVTGVEDVEAVENVNAPIYDLSGRRVLNTVRGGIYIQNGKKFIVK